MKNKLLACFLVLLVTACTSTSQQAKNDLRQGMQAEENQEYEKAMKYFIKSATRVMKRGVSVLVITFAKVKSSKKILRKRWITFHQPVIKECLLRAMKWA